MNHLTVTSRKRVEDNPSYPSFGQRNEVHGKVHYNEVGLVTLSPILFHDFVCMTGHLRRLQGL